MLISIFEIRWLSIFGVNEGYENAALRVFWCIETVSFSRWIDKERFEK
jgi:hypothetical protein